LGVREGKSLAKKDFQEISKGVYTPKNKPTRPLVKLDSKKISEICKD
jgi:hypothetical protein